MPKLTNLLIYIDHYMIMPKLSVITELVMVIDV